MPANFDFHIHSRVSFDSQSDPLEMVLAAKSLGLQEICFTEHWDDIVGEDCRPGHFSLEEYVRTHERLEADIPVRCGIEVGLLQDNQEAVRAAVEQYPFDFVLGSVHCIGREDVYFPRFWTGLSVAEAEARFLECTLECVQKHSDYDVLGHLTYISKTPPHPDHGPVPLASHRELVAEILRTLAQKGKGLEVNTSGVNLGGDFLPGMDYVRLFRDLGGEIVTVGSDAHTPDRVGEHTSRAIAGLADIFGFVCTFVGRQPVFHKL